MKRIISIFLAAVMATGILSLSGCGGDSVNKIKLDPDNPTGIQIWHYYNGPQKEAFDQLVYEFNETDGLKQGIRVETISQGNVTELTQKVRDAVNKKVGASQIPDVFAAYADTAYELDQIGLITDIAQYLTQDEQNDYIQTYLEEGRWGKGNELKIFPTAKSTELFLLNKTDWNKFSTATNASLESLKTMEGLVKTAEAYYQWTDQQTAKPDDGKAFFGRDAMANYLIIGCKQLGVEIFSVKDGKVTINCDEAVLRKLWDNFYVPYINGYFASYGKFASDDAKTGDIIGYVGSASGAAYFPEQVILNDTDAYPIELEVLPAPYFQNGERYAVQQGAGMMVTKSTKEREYASIQFLKWFTEKNRNLAFSTGSGYLPVKKEANDPALLENALSALPDSALARNIKVSMPVALETVSTHKLYTTKAFKQATQARAVLETFLLNQAKEDLQNINAQMENGSSRQEAVGQFDTDQNFKQWFEGFKQELLDTINQ